MTIKKLSLVILLTSLIFLMGEVFFFRKFQIESGLALLMASLLLINIYCMLKSTLHEALYFAAFSGIIAIVSFNLFMLLVLNFVYGNMSIAHIFAVILNIALLILTIINFIKQTRLKK